MHPFVNRCSEYLGMSCSYSGCRGTVTSFQCWDTTHRLPGFLHSWGRNWRPYNDGTNSIAQEGSKGFVTHHNLMFCLLCHWLYIVFHDNIFYFVKFFYLRFGFGNGAGCDFVWRWNCGGYSVWPLLPVLYVASFQARASSNDI